MSQSLRSNQDGVRAASAAISQYQQQINDLKNEQTEVQEKVDNLRTELKATLESLAGGLLPDTSERRVDQLAEKLQAPALTSLRQQWEADRSTWQEEVREIEGDSTFQNRESYVGDDGEWSKAQVAAQEKLDELEQALLPFKHADFQKCYQRKDKPEPSGLSALFLGLFGVLRSRRKSAKAVLDRLQLPDLSQAFSRYEGLLGDQTEATYQLEQVNKQVDDLEEKVKNHELRGMQITHYADSLRAALLTATVEHLQNSYQLKAIRKTMEPEKRRSFSTVLFLREKIQYLEELLASLAKELDDRKKHIRKIQRVQVMWEKNPYGSLKGDKRKWLISLPEQKKKRTQKVINWSRQIHRPVYDYDREDFYDEALDFAMDFLLFDLIADWANESMPYNGYLYEALPSVGDYREEHGETDSTFYGDNANMAAAAAAAAVTIDNQDFQDLS